MKKIANPFFKIGKSLGKGLKVAGLSALAVGGLAAGNHFLGELAPVLIAAIPGPGGVIAAMALTGLATGALEALRNALSHRKVTPQELEELLRNEVPKEKPDEDKVGAAEDVLLKFARDPKRWPDA